MDGVETPGEQYYTSPSDRMSRQCVDYILFRPDVAGRVRVVRDDVVNMDIEDRPYSRLSDHSAVVVHLEIDE